MDLSELTPELFEKTEFTERRRGYDIDQVERFLEETGTAVAQLLVRYRQLEERSSHAESRLAAAESRAAAAEEALSQQGPAPAQPAGPSVSEQEEVEQATSTLLMAKRTADATISEARAEGSGIVSEARAQAERIVTEARVEAATELAEGRARVLESVTSLEKRRDSLSSVVTAFEQRIGDYRVQLREISESLLAMTADPEGLGNRPEVDVPESALGHTQGAVPADAGAGAAVGESLSASTFSSIDQPTQAYDTLGESQDWGSGSWSSAEGTGAPAEAPSSAAAEVEEMISLSDLEPSTGQTNDRFLKELDEAVNEPPAEGEDAMSAFFEPSEEQGRRFGWRR